MNKDENKSYLRFEDLRNKATEFMKCHPGSFVQENMTFEELVHELDVHQVELTIQNEELRRSVNDYIKISHEYEDLYENAPCGYMTLTSKGIISKINMTGSGILNCENLMLKRTPFSQLIEKGWEHLYYSALAVASQTGEKQRLNLKLKGMPEESRWIQTDIQAIFDESSTLTQWRLVFMDCSQKVLADKEICDKQRELTQLNQQLDNKVKERTRQLSNLNRHLWDVQETELKKIASSLHDTVLQTLGYSLSKIKGLKANSHNGGRRDIIHIKDQLGTAIHDLQRIIEEIRPFVLDDFGIDTVLGYLVEKYNHIYDVDFQYTSNFNDIHPISPKVKLTLYRSLNELMMDCICRSGSKRIEIELGGDQFQLFLNVRSSGIEIPEEKRKKQAERVHDLFVLREMIEAIQGELSVSYHENDARSVAIHFPTHQGLGITK